MEESGVEVGRRVGGGFELRVEEGGLGAPDPALTGVGKGDGFDEGFFERVGREEFGGIHGSEAEVVGAALFVVRGSLGVEAVFAAVGGGFALAGGGFGAAGFASVGLGGENENW